MDAMVFKRMATGAFDHAPMSTWKTQIGLGGLRFSFFFFVLQGREKHKGRLVDLREIESDCDRAHCIKFPNSENIMWEKIK